MARYIPCRGCGYLNSYYGYCPACANAIRMKRERQERIRREREREEQERIRREREREEQERIRREEINRKYSQSAKIKNIWVEHNVWEGNLKGMRIHVKFTINNLAYKNCSIDAYFYFENGAALRDFNQKYGTTGGTVASGMDFKPTYINSIYDDFTLFMPYNEFHIERSGKYNLKFFVSIAYNGKGLDSSGYRSFTYTID